MHIEVCAPSPLHLLLLQRWPVGRWRGPAGHHSLAECGVRPVGGASQCPPR